jgi:uncharacterized protein (DUF2252 family)
MVARNANFRAGEANPHRRQRTLTSPRSSRKGIDSRSMSDRTANSYPRYDERQPILVATQRLKMARSAHAFVRGATRKFYDWLEQSDGHAIPDGPPIWICGDCHVGNLGPVADARHKVTIQIRDLDQTVVGNPAHDIIRLGLSLAMAARGSDLPGVTTAHIIEHLMDGYDQALGPLEDGEWMATPAPLVAVLKRACQRRWRHLAEERLEDVRPAIPLGRRFWPLSQQEREAIAALGRSERLRRLVTQIHSRADHAKIEVVDAAYWVKGCSSLGRLRYAVLLRIKAAAGGSSLGLVDIKEAAPAAAPRATDTGGLAMPADSAERVVMGARALAPALGERMFAAQLLGKPVVVRELLPQDLKIEIDQLTRRQACKAARYLGNVVGTAHARQLKPADRWRWKKLLQENRSPDLDAPYWLWTSIVDLVGSHERAYLDHCRHFALEAKGGTDATAAP